MSYTKYLQEKFYGYGHDMARGQRSWDRSVAGDRKRYGGASDEPRGETEAQTQARLAKDKDYQERVRKAKEDAYNREHHEEEDAPDAAEAKEYARKVRWLHGEIDELRRRERREEGLGEIGRPESYYNRRKSYENWAKYYDNLAKGHKARRPKDNAPKVPAETVHRFPG